jgi:hypothetical protein
VCVEFVDERDGHEQPAERSGDSAAGQLPETGASAQTAGPAAAAPPGPAPAGSAPAGSAPTAAAPTQAAPAEA